MSACTSTSARWRIEPCSTPCPKLRRLRRSATIWIAGPRRTCPVSRRIARRRRKVSAWPTRRPAWRRLHVSSGAAAPWKSPRSWRLPRRHDLIGANVKAQVFDQVQKKVGTFAEVFWKEVIVAATTLSHDRKVGTAVVGYDKCRTVSAAINRLVRSEATDMLSGVRVRARHAALRLRGLPEFLPRWSFEEVAVGPHDMASLGVYEYLHDVLAWQEPAQPLRGLWKIAKSAGWIVPHEHVCWVSERPSLIRTDARGRLHCTDGPALRYPDGWCAHAWKGVQVPAWMIEHRQWIDPGENQRYLRAGAAQLHDRDHDAERFVANGGASRVAEDETGVLWRKLWGYRGVTVGSWSAVEVANGTPDAGGVRANASSCACPRTCARRAKPSPGPMASRPTNTPRWSCGPRSTDPYVPLLIRGGPGTHAETVALPVHLIPAVRRTRKEMQCPLWPSVQRLSHVGTILRSSAPASPISCSARTATACGSFAKAQARKLACSCRGRRRCGSRRLESTDEHFAVVHVNGGPEFDYASQHL